MRDDPAPVVLYVVRVAQAVDVIPDEPAHRGILGFDIERFNRPEWTDPIRARLRDRLHRLVDEAVAGTGITPSLTARLLYPLATRLASGLAVDDQRSPATERMRLRVVVHAGEVLADAHGHTGASLNHGARLLEAEATRTILAHSQAATMIRPRFCGGSIAWKAGWSHGTQQQFPPSPEALPARAA